MQIEVFQSLTSVGTTPSLPPEPMSPGRPNQGCLRDLEIPQEHRRSPARLRLPRVRDHPTLSTPPKVPWPTLRGRPARGEAWSWIARARGWPGRGAPPGNAAPPACRTQPRPVPAPGAEQPTPKPRGPRQCPGTVRVAIAAQPERAENFAVAGSGPGAQTRPPGCCTFPFPASRSPSTVSRKRHIDPRAFPVRSPPRAPGHSPWPRPSGSGSPPAG